MIFVSIFSPCGFFFFFLSLFPFLKKTKPLLLGAFRWTQIHPVARYLNTYFILPGTFVLVASANVPLISSGRIFLLELLADWCTETALKITLEIARVRLRRWSLEQLTAGLWSSVLLKLMGGPGPAMSSSLLVCVSSGLPS